MESTALNFALEVDEDWPPVGTECLPFERIASGYRALSVPLFVRDLSVGDIIAPTFDDNRQVSSFTHVLRSGHTTAWLRRLRDTDLIQPLLADLRTLGCKTCSLDSLGCHAIDVPSAVAIADVDERIGHLDVNAVAVAFPSFRHDASSGQTTVP